jgi:hypothetical protein
MELLVVASVWGDTWRLATTAIVMGLLVVFWHFLFDSLGSI